MSQVAQVSQPRISSVGTEAQTTGGGLTAESLARDAAAALQRLFPSAVCLVNLGRAGDDRWSASALAGPTAVNIFIGLPRAAFRAFFREAGAGVGGDCVETPSLAVSLPIALPFSVQHVLAARGHLDGQVVASVFVFHPVPRVTSVFERRTIELLAASCAWPLGLLQQQADTAVHLLHLRRELLDARSLHDALVTISATIVEQRPLQVLLTASLHVALQALHYDAGTVRLYDAQADEVVLAAQVGFDSDAEAPVRRMALTISPLEEVIRRGVVRLVESGWNTQLDPLIYPVDRFPRMESAVSVPITLGDVRLGLLSLLRREPSTFHTREIDQILSLANQLAVLIENHRLVEQRERRLSELDLLSRIQQHAGATRSVQELAAVLVNDIQPLLSASAAAVLLWGPVPQRLSCAAWRTAESAVAAVTTDSDDLPAGLSTFLTGISAGDMQSGIERDGWAVAQLTTREGAMLGLLAVRDIPPTTAAWLDSVLAPQVSLQCENALLLEQHARQIRELEVVGRVGALATSTVSLQHLLEEVQRLVLSVTEARVFYLLICEPATRRVSHSIFVEEGSRYSAVLVGQPVPTGTLSDLVLSSAEPLLLRDLDAERPTLAQRGYRLFSVGTDRPVRSWLGVPLTARGGEVIGVLSVQDYRTYAYDDASLRFLSQVAVHVSLGVQKIQLFADRERQLAENARLFEAAQAHAIAAERHSMRMELVNRISSLLAGRLDHSEIVALSSRELVERFWSDAVVLLLGGQGVPLEIAGEYPQHSDRNFPLPPELDAVLAGLAAARRPQQISDIDLDRRGRVFAAWRNRDVRSVALVPLVSRDSVVGLLLCLNFGTPRSYSGEELDLLMSVATVIASAYQNARLFAAEQAERRTAETLREMARVMSSSVDLEQVMALVLAELARLLPYQAAAVALLDNGLLRFVCERPYDWHRYDELAPSAARYAAEVVATREPLVAELNNGARSAMWIGVPLIAHQHLLGVLSVVLQLRPGTPERGRELLTTIGDHAALAIENAALYQQSVTRVEQELTIARAIQSQLFPRRLPSHPRLQIAASCRPAHETGGDFYDVLDVNRGLAVLIGDVSGKSLPAAMIMAVARSVARSEARSHALPRRVLGETNDWLVGDLPTNTFVALAYALIDPTGLRMSLSSAGQIPPLLRRADGSLSYLDQDGALPLGVRRGAQYTEQEYQLQPGDLLVFSTDGIVSAQNAARELYGFERFAESVRRCPVSEPQLVIDTLLQDVAEFSGHRSPDDDMTIVVVLVGA